MKKVISAIVALIILIPLIIIGSYPFYIGCALVGCIGFYELVRLKEKDKKLPIIVKIIYFILFALLMVNGVYKKDFSINKYYIIASIIVSVLLLLPYGKTSKYDSNDAFYLLGTTLFLGIAFHYIMNLRNLGVLYFFYVILITIFADTFAQFYGCNIGKHKLCPSISPNKTIEGMLGGTIFSVFIGTMFYTTVIDNEISLLLIIGISLFISLMGQCGDLVFSVIKRNHKVKDYGNIMPGHGGVLDRLDSIILAVYAFTIIIELL